MSRPETGKPWTPPEGESIGDRFGEFVPEIGAHQDMADALPSHEDLMAREKHIPLTDEERRLGREEVEKAKKLLGY